MSLQIGQSQKQAASLQLVYSVPQLTFYIT
jgi:hypothetical protein